MLKTIEAALPNMLYKITVALVVYQLVFLCGFSSDIRASCPDPDKNGTQCSKDCKTIGYCYMNTWIVFETCSSDQFCLPSQPILGCNYGVSCQTSWSEDVRCIESGIKVPNLEDTSCSSYYKCEAASQQSRLVSPAEPQYCPAGESFDPCIQGCTSNIECPPIFRCSEEFYFIQLPSNKKLAYACLDLGDRDLSLIWKYCEKGTYDPDTGGCKDEDTEECYPNYVNCEIPGPKPLPNTTCKYRMCLDDGTFIDINCASGYYYDTNDGKCVLGKCSENV